MALAVAAMVCGFIFFPTNQAEVEKPMDANGWVAQLADDAAVVALYVQGLSDEELEEWVEFSENDIFYELTTENLNEDED